MKQITLIALFAIGIFSAVTTSAQDVTGPQSEKKEKKMEKKERKELGKDYHGNLRKAKKKENKAVKKEVKMDRKEDMNK